MFKDVFEHNVLYIFSFYLPDVVIISAQYLKVRVLSVFSRP